MASAFRGVIEFFGRIGIYDVVLPFLLVFTIVFAILEKTKVFGTEKIKDEEVTKKNLNSMVAFVIAFLVVASTRLVAVINEVMANIVLLLLLSVSFLLLIGSFYSKGQEVALERGFWRIFFMIIMFVGIVLIFLNALDWLEPIWDFLVHYYDSTIVGSIILLAVILGFMFFIVAEPKSKKPTNET